jgi:glycosyltransferase involved in cell wall biosynthesis
MVAFHFPPLSGGSGIQRTLRFVQHLPALGWQPLVLSVNPRAYAQTGIDLLAEIPPNTVVQRSLALDTARHLSVRGRYLGWMARPDRWMSWQWAAVRDGLQMIKTYRPQAIWSTYPIATAHLIGAELQRRSGLPWVADFRDPMAQSGYPSDPAVWQSFMAIEVRAFRQAARCVFTTPGAAQTYRARYPQFAKKVEVLENGYDEESFAGLAPLGALSPGKLTLLHSGIVYPSERDPTQLFQALAQVLAPSGRKDGAPKAGFLRSQLCVRFRAPVHTALLSALTEQYGLQDVIELCPPLPYREALAEMVRADALLVMQAANCNAQIPAKLYEYLRAGRPVLGLTDPCGDTASALREAGVDAIAPLDSVEAIASLLTRFLNSLAQGCAPLPNPQAVQLASRQARSQCLANLLDTL